MSIEQMRGKLSVLYKGDWADRVAKMPDAQVAAVYWRFITKEQQANKKKNQGENR